jgi:hypothetical protein
MTEPKDEPYLRLEDITVHGQPVVREFSRKSWYLRVALIVLMWAVVIGFLGFLEGADFAIFLAFFMGFFVLVILFVIWYMGREGVGKAPTDVFRKMKRKGV